MRLAIMLCSMSLLAGCAIDQSREFALEPIQPPGTEQDRDILHYSAAVRSGDLVFVSGVPAAFLHRGDSSEEALDAAYDRAFRTIAQRLEAAGGSWADVVAMTTYHTEFTPNVPWQEQEAVFRRVKDRYVHAPYPAWTAVGVTRLWSEQLIVEINVVARIPRSRHQVRPAGS